MMQTFATVKTKDGKEKVTAGLTNAHKMVNYIRKNNRMRKTIEPRYLLALKSLLSTCSKGLKSEYIAQKQSCVRCHRLNNISVGDSPIEDPEFKVEPFGVGSSGLCKWN